MSESITRCIFDQQMSLVLTLLAKLLALREPFVSVGSPVVRLFGCFSHFWARRIQRFFFSEFNCQFKGESSSKGMCSLALSKHFLMSTVHADIIVFTFFVLCHLSSFFCKTAVCDTTGDSVRCLKLLLHRTEGWAGAQVPRICDERR